MKHVIKIETKPIPKGHEPHRSGSGEHNDKRDKRNRTRGDQQRKAVDDNNN